MRVFLGLGSNLGDREMNLVTARDLLMKHDVMILGQSTVLETEPLGGLKQPKYLNQVVECQTELAPEELLRVCKLIEREMGRPITIPAMWNVAFLPGVDVKRSKEKKVQRWESRIIDIDILFYGDKVVNQPNLIIPHPAILERDFVIAGMLELAPDFIHPKIHKSLREFNVKIPP